MNRLEKIEKDLEKAAECQAKVRELEKQKQEEENSQIVQAVRSMKLTPAELLALLNNPKDTPAASGQTGPKSADVKEKEDEAYEEA